MNRLSFDNKQSIEQLENDAWKDPDSTPLVEKCHAYRKIPIEQLSVEQLRLLISQEIGLQFLVPKAIEQLKLNILSEGDFYAGDLLNALLSINNSYWQTHIDNKYLLLELLKANQERLAEMNQSNGLRQLFKSIDRLINP